MNGIEIREKSENITFEELQCLLSRAHTSNKAKNLYYATADQTVEKLKEKLKNSTCFVAIANDEVAGMIAVEIRNLYYWYHHGQVAVLKLLGVDPAFRGQRISAYLLEKCVAYAAERGIEVIVMDSAEQNVALKTLALHHGFQITDYGLYAANNFYTTVYVKWLKEVPYSAFYRMLRYHLKRLYIRAKYKPGKIRRFGIGGK